MSLDVIQPDTDLYDGILDPEPDERPAREVLAQIEQLNAALRDEPIPEFPRQPRRPVPDGATQIQTSVAPVDEVVTQVEQELDRGADIETALGSIELPLHFFQCQYRERDDNRKPFDAMIRAFLFQQVTGRTYDEMEWDIQRWDDLPDLIGLDGDDPYLSRGTFSYAKKERFDSGTWDFITSASDRILETAYEQGVNPAFLADPPEEEDDSIDETQLKQDAVWKARDLVLSNFRTDRAENKTYDDMDYIKQAAYMAMAGCGTPQGSSRHAASNGKSMSGNNHLRITKQYNYPDIVNAFQNSVEAVHNTLRRFKAYQRPATVAIDQTPDYYWGDFEDGSQLARMVSGLEKKEKAPRGFKWGTISTAGDTIPIILGITPVQEESDWGGYTYPMHRQVKTLVERAQEYLSINLALADRAYDGHAIAWTFDQLDLRFLTPLRKTSKADKYHCTYMAHKDIDVDIQTWELVEKDTKGSDDADDKFDLEAEDEDGEDVGPKSVRLKHLFVPSTSKSARTAVFRTNDQWVNERDAEGFVSRYSQRWTIENEFKVVKNEFMATTHSSEWVVRAFYFYLGCALQNAWRLADFYYKRWHDDLDTDMDAQLTAGEFVDFAAKDLGE